MELFSCVYFPAVVAKGADALEVLKSSTGADKSYGQAGSTTLEQIGWTSYLKATPAAFGKNFKAETLEAMGQGDFAAAGAATTASFTADVFATSAAAISADGGIVSVDLTGSRTGGYIAAKV